MAGPVAIITRAGRTVYKNARGRFISRAAFERELRRGPGGRFRSASEFFRQSTDRAKEALLLERYGGPPLGGGTWVSRMRSSPDVFAEELADLGLI